MSPFHSSGSLWFRGTALARYGRVEFLSANYTVSDRCTLYGAATLAVGNYRDTLRLAPSSCELSSEAYRCTALCRLRLSSQRYNGFLQQRVVVNLSDGVLKLVNEAAGARALFFFLVHSRIVGVCFERTCDVVELGCAWSSHDTTEPHLSTVYVGVLLFVWCCCFR